MPVILYPNAGSIELASVVQAALANSEIHLFQAGSVTLAPGTTLAELVAAECDFTGYAPATVTAFNDPLLSPFGGAQIGSGTKQFAIDAPYTVSNVVQGWWLEDSGGNLICAGEFPSLISLVGAGDGIPIDVNLVFGG